MLVSFLFLQDPNYISHISQAGKGQKWGWNPSLVFPKGHVLIIVPPILQKQWIEEALRFLDGRFWNIIAYPTKTKERGEFWTKVRAEKIGGQGMNTILVASSSVS